MTQSDFDKLIAAGATNFDGQDLSHVDMRGRDISACSFRRANLHGADLRGATLGALFPKAGGPAIGTLDGEYAIRAAAGNTVGERFAGADLGDADLGDVRAVANGEGLRVLLTGDVIQVDDATQRIGAQQAATTQSHPLSNIRSALTAAGAKLNGCKIFDRQHAMSERNANAPTLAEYKAQCDAAAAARADEERMRRLDVMKSPTQKANEEHAAEREREHAAHWRQWFKSHAPKKSLISTRTVVKKALAAMERDGNRVPYGSHF